MMASGPRAHGVDRFTVPLLALAALLPSASASAQTTPVSASVVWPTTAWPSSSPEAQGMSSADLADALDFARTNGVNIHSFTVVRNGAIVLDAYFYPFVPETRHDLASATKSVLSMLVGAAIADGKIDGLQQPLRTVLRPELAKNLAGPATEIQIGRAHV